MIHLQKKLHDRHGATLIMALLLVLVAVVVSFIVVQAATSASLVAGNKSVFVSSADGESVMDDISVSFAKTTYEYTYDNTDHGGDIAPVVKQNGTVISNYTVKYSTNGGQTWSTTRPTLKNVNTLNVRVQVIQAGRVIATGAGYTLKVNSCPVTITADSISDIDEDTDINSLPYTATIDGKVDDGYTLAYKLTTQKVNDYEYNIVPSGVSSQGNYTVSYVNGKLTLKKTVQNTLTLTLSGMDFNGTYTGTAQQSSGTVAVRLNDAPLSTGYTLTYSYTKKGATKYSGPEAPTVTNVSEIPDNGLVVTVTASYGDYTSSAKTYTMKLSAADSMKFTEFTNDTLKYQYTGSPQQGAVQGVTGYKLAADAGSTTITYSYGTTANSAQAPTLTEKGSSLTVTAKATNPNYKTISYQYTFGIGNKTGLTLTAPTTVTKTYNGSALSPAPTPSISGSTILYRTSSNNSSWSTWTDTKPSLTEVGKLYVQAQATKTDYDNSDICSYTLTVTPKNVTVKADDLKIFTEDFSSTSFPANSSYTATVTGLLGTDSVTYTISRGTTYAQSNDRTRTYAITPSGNQTQGNYSVTYTAGTLTVYRPTNDDAQQSVDAVRNYIKSNFGTISYTRTKYTMNSRDIPDEKKPYVNVTYNIDNDSGSKDVYLNNNNSEFTIKIGGKDKHYRINYQTPQDTVTYKVTSIPSTMNLFATAITNVVERKSESESVTVLYNNGTITNMATNVIVTFTLDYDGDLRMSFEPVGYDNYVGYYDLYCPLNTGSSNYTREENGTLSTSNFQRRNHNNEWVSVTGSMSGTIYRTKVVTTYTFTEAKKG